MYKKLLLFLIVFSLTNSVKAQQLLISPYLFGQNAWMPDSIGTYNKKGVINNHWDKLKESRAGSIRIGGKGYDASSITLNPGDYVTLYQLRTAINNIQIIGGEPIVQANYGDNAYTEAQAADLVDKINNTGINLIQRKIKYWVIANEPDRYVNKNSSSDIKTYIKSFSSAMKAKDTSIKIIAPELSTYYAGTRIDDLIGGIDDITGKDTNNRYYVDYISYHFYPYGPRSKPSRSNIIGKINSIGGFDWQLKDLNAKLKVANATQNRTASPLKIAITEANINFLNPKSDTGFGGISANSFLAGQFWAEIMATCMQDTVAFLNFWSAIEGSDLGYLRASNATKKPTWYHFNLVASNFKGIYCPGTITTGQADFKAFGSNNNGQISVLLMNQKAVGGNYSYTIRLGSGSASGSSTVKLNIQGLELNKEYTDVILDESTILLLFDSLGNLIFKSTYGYTNAGYDAPRN